MEKEVKEELYKMLAQMTVLNNGEIAIREGKALDLRNPVPVNIVGTIDSPLRWLEKRVVVLNPKQCHVQVNRSDMAIGLNINERDSFSDCITGKLLLSDEYIRFGINEGKYMTGLELSDLIRMNRSCFESKQKAMELVTIMRNFKAKVTTQIEASDDKKGNRTALVRQVVEGNQPPSFELAIPIFKGQPKRTFTVEIDIDPDTLQATLVSPDAQDIIAETRDQLINDVLNSIQDLCPDIPIIEI